MWPFTSTPSTSPRLEQSELLQDGATRSSSSTSSSTAAQAPVPSPQSQPAGSSWWRWSSKPQPAARMDPSLTAPPASTSAAQPSTSSPARSLKLVEVQPFHVVLGGTAVMAAGAAATAVVTYRSGGKSLAEDGINPDVRLKIIPVAMKTLLLSTLLTGGIGFLGFMALRASGLITADRAELLSATEAARFLQQPKAFVADLVASEQQREAQRKSAAAQSAS